MDIKKRKLITLIITAMVLTGFCVAPVTAKHAPVVSADAPVIIGGVEFFCKAAIVIAGVLGMVVVKEVLEKRYADVHEYLQKVYDGFTSWLSPPSEWIRVDSNEAQNLFDIENALYESAPSGPDGKKPDELEIYHETRVTKDGKIEINKKAIEDAINILKDM